MKIVLDTNVLVAGLLSPFGPCAQIVRLVSSGTLILCVDARILSEYHEVLRRPKFHFEQEMIDSLLDYIDGHGRNVASSPLSHPLPDPEDEPFLEVALAGKAEYLVTGNHAHFPDHLCQAVKRVSPAGFVQLYRKRQRDRGAT